MFEKTQTDMKTKIVFFGSSDFASPVLSHLLEEKESFEIKGVVTKGENEVKKLAIEANIPYIEDKKEISRFLKELDPDICILASYGEIISRDVMNMPKYGFLVVHPSMLPKLRGAIPMQEAIYEGLKKSGISIVKMSEKFDSGGILVQKEADILDNETFGDLAYRIFELGGKLLIGNLKGYIEGSVKLKEQDEKEATYCYIKDMERIKSVDINTHSANQIERSVRALSPYDYPSISIKGIEVLLIEVRALDLDLEKEVGDTALIKSDGEKSLYIKCEEGFLEILKLKPKGKNVMMGADFANGYLR